MSVAGVHRRAYRRGADGTAAYGTSYYATVNPAYSYGGYHRAIGPPDE